MSSKFVSYQKALAFYRAGQQVKFKNRYQKDQFERASLSVVLNLSEGSGKRTRKDKINFYSIAMGSLRESYTLLENANQEALAKLADELGAYIYKLIQNPGGI